MGKDSETQYIESCFGKNPESGLPNCEIMCTLSSFIGNIENPDNIEIVEETSRHTVQAEFSLSARDAFASVDLTWSSALDPDLRLFWNHLEQYGRKLDSVQDFSNPDEVKPIMYFTILSVDYMEKGYLTIINPLFWALIPEYVGGEACNKIRMFVSLENFAFTKMDEQEMQEIIDKKTAEATRSSHVIYTEN
jgi:hypothetical protein